MAVHLSLMRIDAEALASVIYRAGMYQFWCQKI